jgi:hypothetical protein
MFYILKQFTLNSDIWVVKLNPDDPEYSYDTLEEAESAFPTVQANYPDNTCEIKNITSANI